MMQTVPNSEVYTDLIHIIGSLQCGSDVPRILQQTIDAGYKIIQANDVLFKIRLLHDSNNYYTVAKSMDEAFSKVSRTKTSAILVSCEPLTSFEGVLVL